MSDIDRAVKASKYIESALVRMFSASGKGLHEKVASVEKKLPVHLVKRIRYIATIRNKVIHDDSYRKMDDRAAFKSAVKLVKKELKKMERPSGMGWKIWFLLLMLLLVAAGFMALYFEWVEW
ncbi:MAG: DUF4145 domain-containing protein [Gammaproteobacteria bacterium]|nr:DUF4145 domain-containing protein [Gammaproteobacteria bacterium]